VAMVEKIRERSNSRIGNEKRNGRIARNGESSGLDDEGQGARDFFEGGVHEEFRSNDYRCPKKQKYRGDRKVSLEHRKSRISGEDAKLSLTHQKAHNSVL